MSSSSSSFKKPFEIILGSSSESRRYVLEAGGYTISDVIKPRTDEKAIGDRSSAARAHDLVALIGHAKADDVLGQVVMKRKSNPDTSDTSDTSTMGLSHRVILTGDQVVCWRNEIMEKPVDDEEAKRFIKRFHLHPVRTVGSIVLTNCVSNKRVEGVDNCTIHFSEIPEHVIDRMVADGEVVHCCGALMIEHPLIRPYIRSIEGSEAAVRGIDLDHLARLINELRSSDLENM